MIFCTATIGDSRNSFNVWWATFNQIHLTLNLDIILVKKAGNGRHRELCFSDPIRFRIDGVVVLGFEVGLLKYCIVKNSLREVTIIEDGTGQIRFRKIGFLQLAISEYGLFDFDLKER